MVARRKKQKAVGLGFAQAIADHSFIFAELKEVASLGRGKAPKTTSISRSAASEVNERGDYRHEMTLVT